MGALSILLSYMRAVSDTHCHQLVAGLVAIKHSHQKGLCNKLGPECSTGPTGYWHHAWVITCTAVHESQALSASFMHAYFDWCNIDNFYGA